MKTCGRTLLAALLLWGCLHAQSDSTGVDASRIPARPPGHVLDQARWLTAEEKEAAQGELSQRFTENNIDIYLVTLRKLPPQGAETFARTLGEAWARSPVWCVVFQVPGDPAGFHAEAGGVDMDLAAIDQTLKEAVRRARRENSEKDRFTAAWRECSEGLRYIHGARLRQNKRNVDATKEYFADKKQGKFRRWATIAAAAAGLLFLAAASALVVLRIRSRRATYTFPGTSWRTRFQGPHSGGSGIVVNYRRKRLR